MPLPSGLVKARVSPDWSVPGEIVTVAPVKSVSLEVTVTPASIATADAPAI